MLERGKGKRVVSGVGQDKWRNGYVEDTFEQPGFSYIRSFEARVHESRLLAAESSNSSHRRMPFSFILAILHQCKGITLKTFPVVHHQPRKVATGSR
jgi:hypothetical protein